VGAYTALGAFFLVEERSVITERRSHGGDYRRAWWRLPTRMVAITDAHGGD